MWYKIKRILDWTKEVRPNNPKTFTITWTEGSNMSSGWTYSDDAAWLTAGSSAFDKFFWYYGCRLDGSWSETATITQWDSWWAWKLDITQLWTLTSGDNVMIAFPVRWIKMSKSWSTVTLSITEELDKAGYQYYAHCTWTLSSPWTPKDAFYLWAYEATLSSDVFKSWSWASPVVSQNIVMSSWYSRQNWTWYNILWYYQRMYINCLYIMKYWNPDSQSVVGRWYTGWSSRVNTWWTNSQTNATYWTTSSTVQCKLFWLEDWWGNVNEWVWWAYTDSGKALYTQLSWYTWSMSGWEFTWGYIASSNSWQNLSSIVWTNNVLFWTDNTVKNSSYNTYYCDYNSIATSSVAASWWFYSCNSMAWVFYITFTRWTNNTSSAVWARIMYL